MQKIVKSVKVFAPQVGGKHCRQIGFLNKDLLKKTKNLSKKFIFHY